jgi:hypothetical protein
MVLHHYRLLLQDNATLNWIDTFAFTDSAGPIGGVGEGGIVFTTNKLAQYGVPSLSANAP